MLIYPKNFGAESWKSHQLSAGYLDDGQMKQRDTDLMSWSWKENYSKGHMLSRDIRVL